MPMRSVFLLRLSKTGSSSLAALIEQQVGTTNTCPEIFQYKLKGWTAGRLEQYQFIHGHINLEFIEKNIPDARIITVLREPQARIISAYFRWRERFQEGRRLLHETAILAGELSFEKYLESDSPAIQRSIWNFQSRILAGASWGEDHFRHQQAFGPRLNENKIVDLAKSTIDRLFFVGITERMSETVANIFELLGWPKPIAIPHLNSTTSRDQIFDSKRIRELLGRNSALDLEIYEYALDKFKNCQMKVNL
jgi:hypothetical protein